MSDFQIWFHNKFIGDAISGRLDMAVLEAKFIKAGLYKLTEENKTEEIHLVGLYSDTLEGCRKS